MKNNRKTSIILLAMLAGLILSTVSSRAQGAIATISDVSASGGFNYTISLTNPGSDAFNLNSFWYGWTQGGNNLPSNPSVAINSIGWDNDLDGNSVMWINKSGTALAPGQTATFSFFSTSSPAAITTSPSGESVAYVGGIDFSQGVAGDSTGIFSPTPVAAPEPSSMALLTVSLFGMAAIWRTKRRLA